MNDNTTRDKNVVNIRNQLKKNLFGSKLKNSILIDTTK